MSGNTLTDLIFAALKLRYDEKDRQAAEYLVNLIGLASAVENDPQGMTSDQRYALIEPMLPRVSDEHTACEDREAG